MLAGQNKPKKRLGERLKEAGVIDDIQLTVALGMQKESGLLLGRQLLKIGFVDEPTITKFLLDETDLKEPIIARKITPQALAMVPEDMAFRHNIIPIQFDGKTLVVATSNPKDISVLDAISFRIGKRVKPVKALEWDIENALLKFYKGFSEDELGMLKTTSEIADQYKATTWTFDNEMVLEPTAVRSDGSAADAGANPMDDTVLFRFSFHEVEEPVAKQPSAKPEPAPKPAPMPAKATAVQPAPTKATPAPPAPKPAQPAQPPATQPAQQAAARPTAQQSTARSALRKHPSMPGALMELLIEKKLITERELLTALSKVLPPRAKPKE